MLHETNVVSDIGEDGRDRVVGFGSRNLLGVPAELDQVLQHDLYHVVQAWSTYSGEVLN